MAKREELSHQPDRILKTMRQFTIPDNNSSSLLRPESPNYGGA
jgi:hypothetical protein